MGFEKEDRKFQKRRTGIVGFFAVDKPDSLPGHCIWARKCLIASFLKKERFLCTEGLKLD